MPKILSKEEKITVLKNDVKTLNEQATIAYKNGNYDLENKYQKKIDEANNIINTLQSQIDQEKYANVDIEKIIKDLRNEHKWTEEGMYARCNGCSMKRETFKWKAQGIRENAKDKYPFSDIVEGARCSHRFG